MYLGGFSEYWAIQHLFVLAEASVILSGAFMTIEFTVAGRVAMALLDMRMLDNFVCGFLVSFGRNQFLQTDDGADDQCNFTDD